MKRKINLLLITCLIVICTMLAGCSKTDSLLVGNWENIFNNDNQIIINHDILNIFNDAKEKYTDGELEPVALLGSQVVAGQNYMFLVHDYENATNEYKIAIVYNDLDNNSTITSVQSFDYTKYVNINFENNNNGIISGGWQVNNSDEEIKLDDNIQSIFDNATSTLTGMSFMPIAVLGKQIVSGTNYAILCYGKSSIDTSWNSIYVLTLYEDLNGNCEIVSHSYINLADFNG